MYPDFIIEVTGGGCHSQKGSVNGEAGQETRRCAVGSVSGGCGLKTEKTGEERNGIIPVLCVGVPTVRRMLPDSPGWSGLPVSEFSFQSLSRTL